MSRKKKKFYRISKKSTELFSVRRNKLGHKTIISAGIEYNVVQAGSLPMREQDRWGDKPWVAKTGKMNIESRLEGTQFL